MIFLWLFMKAGEGAYSFINSFKVEEAPEDNNPSDADEWASHEREED